jgi:hypothetical protein
MRIFSVFAGRRRYMNILSRYIDELYKRKLIEEIHIWDYTRTQEDEEWLNERWPNNIMSVKDKSTYKEYYQYYTRERYPEEDTILIKCDDDIVYIDVDKFQKFIEMRPCDVDSLFVSPFVVNNPVCTTLLGIKFDNTDPFTSEHANTIHNMFFDGSLDTIPVMFYEATHRTWTFNINFVTFMSRDFDLLQCIDDNDEDRINMLSIEMNRRIGIYTGLVTCHMAYTAQRENGFDETELLKRYHDLCIEKCS